MDFNENINKTKIECVAKTNENMLLLVFMILIIVFPFIITTSNSSINFSIFDFIYFIYIEFPKYDAFIGVLTALMLSCFPIIMIEWFLRVMNTKLIIDGDDITYTNYIGITYKYKTSDIKTYKTLKTSRSMGKTFIYITMTNNKKITMHSTDSNADKLIEFLKNNNKLG